MRSSTLPGEKPALADKIRPDSATVSPQPRRALRFDSKVLQQFPLSEDYDSQIPTIFLSEISRLSQLPKVQRLIARDGLEGLAVFQSRFSAPSKLKCQLIAHRECAHIVEGRWRKHFAAFTYHSPEQSTALDGVVFAGTNGPSMRNQLSLAKEFKNALARISSRKPRMYVVAPIAIGQGAADTYRNIRMLLELTKLHLTFVDWNELDEVEAIDRLVLIELNDRVKIADSHLTHTLMAKGARLSTQRRTSVRELYSPVSIHHGFRIGPLPKGQRDV